MSSVPSFVFTLLSSDALGLTLSLDEQKESFSQTVFPHCAAAQMYITLDVLRVRAGGTAWLWLRDE